MDPLLPAALALTVIGMLSNNDEQKSCAPPPIVGTCHGNPWRWAQGKLADMTTWWNGIPGETVRRMSPIVFPGLPPEAFLGFMANGSQFENTTTRVPTQSFHELGWFGTEGGPRDGPAPNPDPSAPNNNWGKYAGSELVRQMLGRSATMVHNGWKTAIADQCAVGLVSVRGHGRNVVRGIDPSVRPQSERSLWFLALCFSGWSAGDTTAARHVMAVANQLSQVPENQRWARWIQIVASSQPPANIPRSSHRNPAHTVLRTYQKLAASQLLAYSHGGPSCWFSTRLGNAESALANAIACAGE